jgi:nucleoid-associated protein YgaU
MAIKRTINDDTKVLGSNDLRRSGTEVYRAARPIKIKVAADDSIIIANEGDRLDLLATKFYGSPRYWFVLASVNDLVNGSMHVKPGTQLRIPAKNRVL